MTEDTVNIPINDYNGKSFQLGVPKSIAKQYKEGSDDEKERAQKFIENAAKDHYHANYEVPPEQQRHMGVHLHLPESIVTPEQRENASKVYDAPDTNGPGILSRLGSLAASPITGLMNIPGELKNYFQGDIKPTGGFSSDNPTDQMVNDSMLAMLPPEPNATNLTNAGRMIKGGLKGGYEAAKSSIPFRGLNVPAVIPGAIAGGWLGRDLFGAEGATIGAVLGGAAPIVRGAIQGAREAPRVFANTRPAVNVGEVSAASPVVRPQIQSIPPGTLPSGRVPGGLANAQNIATRTADATAGPVIPNAPSNIPVLNPDTVTWPPRGQEAAPTNWAGSGTPRTPVPPESYKSYGSGKLSDINPNPTWPPQKSAGQEPAPLDWFGGSSEELGGNSPGVPKFVPRNMLQISAPTPSSPGPIITPPPAAPPVSVGSSDFWQRLQQIDPSNLKMPDVETPKPENKTSVSSVKKMPKAPEASPKASPEIPKVTSEPEVKPKVDYAADAVKAAKSVEKPKVAEKRDPVFQELDKKIAEGKGDKPRGPVDAVPEADKSITGEDVVNYANNKPYITPKMLATKLGVSMEKANSLTKELVKSGHLTTEGIGRYKKTGKGFETFEALKKTEPVRPPLKVDKPTSLERKPATPQLTEEEYDEPQTKIYINHDALYKLTHEMGDLFKPTQVARVLKKMGHDVEPSKFGKGSWEKGKGETTELESQHEQLMMKMIPQILKDHPDWY
jgi:hypothetical protein